MSYKIIAIPSFNRDLKSLSKKHRSIPKMSVEILENCFKIRMTISSKGKGKSGGARVISMFISKAKRFIYFLFTTNLMMKPFQTKNSGFNKKLGFGVNINH
jgi:mRNA-degrading endonuclease RelE of RelBE toxin-antitoxin system